MTAARLSVAPMMDWTDRHCRMFHRTLSRRTLLYTEMVTAQAVVHGPADRLLAFHPAEHPVAAQIGGSDPGVLSQATRIAADLGYDEVNLNVGCPSDRVQSGAFGAVLMTAPEKVADCVAAMIAAAPVAVTVKCRIGVDDQVPARALPEFLETVAAAGVSRFIVHARMAWLDGLSPKENRDIPPLDYDLVAAMVTQFPDLSIAINGGIGSLDSAAALLERGFDGAMIGRAAYHDPAAVLLPADARLFADAAPHGSMEAAIDAYLAYVEEECRAGTRLNAMTRHLMGAFNGRPGARAWRRMLSEGAHVRGAGPDLIRMALTNVTDLAA